MKDKNISRANTDISFDEFDDINNPRPAQNQFDAIVEAALTRRGFLSGVVTFGTSAFIVGTSSLKDPVQAATNDRFGFKAVAVNTKDTITVPDGYKWDVLAQWGQPLWSNAPDFDENTRGDSHSQARAIGDNNDGMALFQINGRHVLVANNEYTNRRIIFGNRDSKSPETVDDIAKGKAAHGVTIAEIKRTGHTWKIVKDSPLSRRITPDTPMKLTGPAAGHALLKTAAEPTGTKSLGTWNNCGNGETPWGTYLACEENFNGYFSSSDPDYKPSKSFIRYGIYNTDYGFKWAKVDDRFDIAKHPNEPNRAGYVVEIDPSDPYSIPKKRTALGRFKHENAEVVIAENGKIVVYMGDDERGEFLYRYVSNNKYSKNTNTDDLLNNGVLYAAKFNDTQRGEWLALTPETTGMSHAEICIHTRLAASIVGATTMDRPEWVTVNPTRTEAYVALTNNKRRGVKPNRGGDETPVGGPNPRRKNRYGQIVRWVPDMQDHSSDTFSWDIFALAGNPEVHDDAYAGSPNINAGNMFSSPDGISFDSKGLLWIQTDGKYTNTGNFAGMGNNQMLAGDPVTGEIRRFLVGPKEAEITGLTWSADKKTMFVGVQHPGERGNSNFPNGGNSVPRSCIITISRDDSKEVG